ncbi:MAG: toll/interleukin-1 receptor domain-containing protein [Chlorobiaceae bacterium]|nr:toll/interleukin-1 receptor domain-containing protein [Chlorobiaceae bacterium]
MDVAENPVRKDFFISYSSADEQWAEWIAWQLKEAGYALVLQKWDFHAGGNFILEMHRAAIETERTLAVLSPRYLDALYTHPEWAAALVQDPIGNKRLLIPVRIEDFMPAGLFASLIYVDLVGLEATEAQANLLAKIRASIQGGSHPPVSAPKFPGVPVQGLLNGLKFPGTLPPLWNVPYQRNTNFTGREDVLANLQYHFKIAAHKASSKQVLHGLGGVGKSQIAAEYCYRNSVHYDVVWWLRAEDASSLLADYVALAGENLLNLPQKDAQEQEEVIKAVRDALNHRGKWILVFDNARDYESIADYLPQASGGHVLITSQNHDWRQLGTPHEIVEWPRPESISFLQKRTGITDQAGTDEISNALGDLPLALEQAGAYIVACGIAMSAYLELFNKQRSDLWKEESGPLDHKQTVEVTFGLSIEQARIAEPMAEKLLNLCSVVAPDEVPMTLLRSCDLYVQCSTWKGLDDPIVMNRALRELKKYSLITTDKESVSLHRLVQAVVCDCMGTEFTNQCRETMLKVLKELFPGDGNTEPSCWPKCAMLLPHAEKVTKEFADDSGAGLDVAVLLNRMAAYRHGRGEYAEAEALLRRVLGILEMQLGPDNPDVGVNLNNLAESLRAQSNYAEAETLYMRALVIREKQFGKDHPFVAISLNNLGLLFYNQGKYAVADPLLRRALEIMLMHYGSDHPNVAINLNHLAILLDAQGKYHESEALHRRALDIHEKQQGSDHPNVASSLNHLALWLYNQGKFVESESLFRRALMIREKQQGSDHPDVANGLHNLALTLYEQGKYVEAESLLRRSLIIIEKRQGLNHPNMAKILTCLGVLLSAQEKYGDSETLLKQALEIREKRLSHDHPDVANGLHNLALTLYKQEKYVEAEPLFRRALGIVESKLGQEHPLTKMIAENLNQLLNNMKKK